MTIAMQITGGIDTHLDVHVAAALDERGGLLGVESFDTTTNGYQQLLAWLEGIGAVELVGVEGTGSYGAGLTRHLHSEGVTVVEVDRPNRQVDAGGASDPPWRRHRSSCRPVRRRHRPPIATPFGAVQFVARGSTTS